MADIDYNARLDAIANLEAQRAKMASISNSAARSSTIKADRDILPNGYREMTGVERLFSRAGDIGDTIIGLSGFGENYAKAKEDLANGALDAGQALKTAGSFLANIPLGIISAPFSAAQYGYEALTGTPISEHQEDYIPDYELSPEQRAAAGLYGAIDIAGLAAGATGGVLRGAKTAIKTSSLARAVDAAKAPLMKTVGGRIAYQAGEEGAEEFVQSYAEDIRGTQESHGINDDSLSKAIESAVLGAIGGSIMSGSIEGLNAVLGGKSGQTDPKTTDTLPPQVEEVSKPGTFGAKAGDDIIVGVQDEMLKDKANMKDNPSSASGRGIFDRNGKLSGPDRIIVGWGRLYAMLAQENAPGASNRAWTNWLAPVQISVGNRQVDVLGAFQEAERSMQRNPQQAQAIIDQIKEAVNAHCVAHSQDLELYLSKPPGDKIGFVRVFIQGIEDGDNYSIANVLGVALNADTDGDNYQLFAQKPEGQPGHIAGASLWQTLVTYGQDYKKQGYQAHMVKKTPATNAAFSELYDNIIDHTRLEEQSGISSKNEFMELINLLYEQQFGTPQQMSSAISRLDTMSKNAHGYFPRSIFEIFTIAYNTSRQDADTTEAALNKCWKDITTKENYDVVTDAGERIEQTTNGTIRTNAADLVNARVRRDRTARQYNNATKEETIYPVQMGDPSNHDSFLAAIVDLFQPSRSVFATPTRLNLVTMFQIKSIAEEVYQSRANSNEAWNNNTGIEKFLNRLMEEDADIAALGLHPMEQTTAILKQAAFSSAELEYAKRTGKSPDFSHADDFIENEFKKAWEKAKKKWDIVCKETYNGFTFDGAETIKFPEFNSENAYVLLYDSVQDKTVEEFFGNIHLSDDQKAVLMSEAVSNVYKNKDFSFETTYPPEVMQTLTKMAAAIRNKAIKDQERIENTLKQSCELNRKFLEDIASRGYDLDAFIESQKQNGNIAYRQIAQHIQGLYGVTRAGDMRENGWLTVNQIFRRAKDGDKVARMFLSGDVNNVKHAIVILAMRGQLDSKVAGTDGVYSILKDMRDNKATRESYLDAYNRAIGHILDTSPLYNQICLMLNEVNGKNGLSDEVIEQKIQTVEALISEEGTLEDKQNRIAAAEPRNANKILDTFFVDSITKISESDDMQTPQSRFLQYSRFFKESSLISQVPKHAEQITSWIKRPENSGRTNNIINNLGVLYETNWLENVQQSMAVTLANQSMYSQYRARKTNTPSSDATIWSAFTRAGASGAVTSEFGNMAFMSSSYNWNDIMGNPSILGRFLFTDFLETVAGENTNGRPNLVKIVLGDGTPVYVKDKIDFARLLVPEDVRSSLFNGRSTWTSSDLEILLQYQPVLSEVFNPISYTTQEINGQAVIKPSHRFTFDEADSSIFKWLENPRFDEDLLEERTNAQILQSVLKDRDGMLLLYSMIDDRVFENPGDFQATKAAVNRAIKNTTLFWKRYLWASETQRQEMLNAATGRAYFDRAKVLANQWNSEIMTQHANAALENTRLLGDVQGALLQGVLTGDTSRTTDNALQFMRNAFTNLADILGQGMSKEKIGKVRLLRRVAETDSNLYTSSKFETLINGLSDYLQTHPSDRIAARALDIIRYLDFALSLVEDGQARDNVATALLSTIGASARQSTETGLILEQANNINGLLSSLNININNVFDIGSESRAAWLTIDTDIDDRLAAFDRAIDEAARDDRHTQFLDAIEDNVRYVAERLGIAENQEATTAFILAGEAGKKPGDALLKAFNDLRAKETSTRRERIQLLKNTIAPYVSFDEDQAIIDQATIDTSFAKVSDRLTRDVKPVVMSAKEQEEYEKIKGSIKFSVLSDYKRMGLEQVLGEIVAGNVNDGVSMNASERNYLIPFIDYNATMQTSNVFTEQASSPATINWNPQYFDNTQKIVQYYSTLGDNNWKICGTYLENGQLKQINPAVVEKWRSSGESKPIQAAYFISMPNAGFDARFRLPSPNANGTQNSFLYALDQILIDCSEALNLLSKKKGDQYAAISYGLDNQAGRADVQSKSYGSIRNFVDLVNMVSETKDAYVNACVQAYQSDTAHKSIKVTAKNFYDLVNHQVQRIFTFDQYGNQTIFAWNDLLDPQSEQRQMFEQMLSSGQIRNAKVDIMTVTELGAEIGRARPTAAEARGYQVSPTDGIDSATQNARMQEIFADQVEIMRHRSYRDPYSQISKDISKVSGITFGTNRFRTDSFFGQNPNEINDRAFSLDQSTQIRNESREYFRQAHQISGSNLPIVYDLSPVSSVSLPAVLRNAFNDIQNGTKIGTISNQKACIFLETTNRAEADTLVTRAMDMARKYDLAIAIRSDDTVASELIRNKMGLASYRVIADRSEGRPGELSGLVAIEFTQDFKNTNSTVRPEFSTLKEHPRLLQLFSSAIPAGDGMVRINKKAARDASKYQKSQSGKLTPGINYTMLPPSVAAKTNINYRTDLVTDQIALGLKSKDYSSEDIIQAVKVFKQAAENLPDNGQHVKIKSGHIVCAGLAKQTSGGKTMYKPILVETSGNPSYETIEVIYADGFQTVNYHINYKSGPQYIRGDAQKFFFDGIKGMCVEDEMAERFSLGGDLGKNVGIAVLDRGNNGAKYSSDEYNIAEKYYFWAKDNHLSMFYEPDNQGGFKVRDDIVCDNTIKQMFLDPTREDELLTHIYNGDVTFRSADPRYQNRLNKIIRNIASVCYAKHNFFEHFTAFTVNSDMKTIRPMTEWYSSVMAAFPNTMTYDDFAVLYNFISPDTFSLENSATLLSNYDGNPNTYLPRFSRDGKILVFNENMQPMYEECAYGTYINDVTSSSSDAFFGMAKVGEKPMTTTLFGVGQDMSADYTNLRVESDMVLGLGLDDVSEYYKNNKQRRQTTDPKQTAFLNRVGLSNLAGNENYEEATQYLYSIHSYNLKEITDNYDTQHIKIKDGNREIGIFEDRECSNLLDAIKSKFAEDAPCSAEKWEDVIEGIVKKYLGWSPNVAGKNDGQMSFTAIEVRTALNKALKSLDNGVFFDIAEGGIENFTLYSSGRNYTRYIVPYCSEYELSLLTHLNSNAKDISTLKDLNKKKVEAFVKALKDARTNTMQRSSLLTLVDAFSTKSDLGVNTGHVRDRYYLSDLLRQGDEILRYSTEYKDVQKLKEVSEANRKIFGKEIEYGIRRNQITLDNQYGVGGRNAYDVSSVDTTITKLANQLCEVNKMMRVLNPLLMPASILERLGYTTPSRFLLANGIQTGRGVFSSNLKNLISDDAAKQIVPTIKKIASGNQIRKVFGDFKIANTFATTSWAMEAIDSAQDVSSFIKEHANETALQRIANAEFDFMTGRGIGQKTQIEVFFLDLIRCVSLDERLSAYMRPTQDGTSFVLLDEINRDGVEKFFLKCFATDSPLRGVAGQAMNLAMRGDAAQKTVFSTIFYEYTNQHPGFKFFSNTLFSPFMQYGWNITSRHLNCILPMSTLNYVLCELGSSYGIPLPGLRGFDEQTGATRRATTQDLNLQDAKIAATIREALLMDLSHMGATFTAALLVAMAGGIEPPEDEDKWCNVEEWTFFGNRIQENWWIQDLLGPTLAYAVTIKSTMMGKPSPETFVKSMSDLMYANPLMKFSDVFDWIMNPYGKYMESYYQDVERYSENMDGEQTALQVLGDNIGVGTLEYLFQFITPSIVKEIYKNSQIFEASYKNIYTTDKYGERDDGTVQKATHFDQRLRLACRNNPFLALFADLVTNNGENSGGTGYLATQMPRTVYYDPEQIDSLKALSFYNDDGTRKSETECDAIAVGALCKLLAYDSMEDLQATGFAMPRETMIAVGDMIWDIVWDQKCAFDEILDSNTLDPYIIGDGDVEEGRKIIEQLQASYDNTYNFWTDVYYNKLYSPEMKQGAVGYNRLATGYAQDANGNWYATGFTKTIPNMILPFKLASGTTSNPGPTAGWADEWATPSAVTGEAMYDDNGNPMRVLVPVDEEYFRTPDFDELGGNGDGTGYSKTTSNRGKSGGSGGGYSRGGFVQAPNVYLPSYRGTTMPYVSRQDAGSTPVRGIDLTLSYLRPQFETKGSRQAFRREDI